MLVIGLTGSIGMGKSTVAEHLRTRGVPVCDADRLVHEMYAGPAVKPIEEKFPGVTLNGQIDRKKLSEILIKDPTQFERLESIIHPMVRDAERKFLQNHAEQKTKMAVLEIPLLFESGTNDLVDLTIVVSTNEKNQRDRVLERPGMSALKLDEILARQMPDNEKRARADFVVDTSGTIEQTKAAVDKLLETLHAKSGDAFNRHWA